MNVTRAVVAVAAIAIFSAPLAARQSPKPPTARPASPSGGPSASPSASLPSLASRAEFDRLARVVATGRGTPMPHVLFAIDRAAGDEVSYIDSNRFRFHRDFVNATYRSLERGEAFYEKNYSSPSRRFLFGTIAYQVPLEKFTFEFYQGDDVSPELVALAARRLSETFFAPLTFVARSPNHEAAAAKVPRLAFIRAEELTGRDVYYALNPGETWGVLRVLDRITPDTVVDRNEIVIISEPPVSITPVSGIINTLPPSPLSHLNVLARSWKVPNVYIKRAAETYRGLIGKYVYLKATPEKYEIRLARPEELAEVQRREILHSQLVTPKADLGFSKLAGLDELRAGDSIRFGAKSANLGEAMAAKVAGMTVPRGFAIPFAFYDRFVKENGIEDDVYEVLDDQRFNHDVAYRRERLAALRERIASAKMPEEMARAIVERAHRELGDAGLFVRSSTNAEDLPGFSGAGLYTTVPNVKGDEALLAAVKTVWGSIWNDGAYEARAAAGMSQIVYPGVLVQLGMNADAAGVLVTTNPFDSGDDHSIFVNAKRGLGIRVVDGHKVAEQILVDPRTNEVRVLTRSADDTMLAFAPDGGVREIEIEPNRAVLTDDLVRRLATVAEALERHFGVGALDVEWLTIGDDLYVVQVRPFQK